MKIIPFEKRYRDDLIFMVLEAKNALGRVPGLNEDMLDIKKNYLDNGGMFWIALDDSDRVMGCVGYVPICGTNGIYLHRLYVKYTLKHRGIGTELLNTLIKYAKKRGKNEIYVHLGTPKEQWYESYAFYPKNGFHVYEDGRDDLMKKEL